MLKKKLKSYFFTGLIVIVPGYITFYIVYLIIRKMDSFIQLLPSKYHPETYLHFKIPGLGAIATFLLILIVGILFTNIFGKKILGFLEDKFVKQIPFVGSIYKGTKQIIETIFSHDTTSFKEVILVEFPKEGCFAIAFITNYLETSITDYNGVTKKFVAVFLPTTPNPTSGYLMILPEDKVIKTNMSIDAAFRMIISGGVLAEKFDRKI